MENQTAKIVATVLGVLEKVLMNIKN